MSRPGFTRLFTAAVIGAFALTSAFAGDADAQRRRAKKAAVKSASKINQKALGELMGPYKFGMAKKDILGILSKQISRHYKEKISQTTDVYAQDKLRRQKKSELSRIKKSYVDFTGVKTGWDVSIIDDQFAHNTGESMMVHWENSPETGQDQRRFFFFHEGRLYKMFIALNTSKLRREQRNFAFFKGLMEARYGAGTVRTAKAIDGTVANVALDWASSSHEVSAIDKLDFYGAFCLSVADPATAKTLRDMRKSRAAGAKTHSILDSVVEGDDDEGPTLDDNKAGVDKLLNN